MTTNKFGDYIFNRQVCEFGELCADLGVDLTPFTEIVTHYCLTEDMEDQGVRDELVRLFEIGIAQSLGNMAGSAWGSVRNGFNNFNQGFQNGQQRTTPAQNDSGKQLLQQVQQANNIFKQIQQSTTQIQQSNIQVANMLKQMTTNLNNMKSVTTPVA